MMSRIPYCGMQMSITVTYGHMQSLVQASLLQRSFRTEQTTTRRLHLLDPSTLVSLKMIPHQVGMARVATVRGAKIQGRVFRKPNGFV